jgi:hypothetical protein
MLRFDCSNTFAHPSGKKPHWYIWPHRSALFSFFQVAPSDRLLRMTGGAECVFDVSPSGLLFFLDLRAKLPAVRGTTLVDITRMSLDTP